MTDRTDVNARAPMTTTMGGRQSSRMQTEVWLTPPTILTTLGPFDLDPCAAPQPRPWPTAAHHYTLPQDGLALPWYSGRRKGAAA